jgi:RNA polymerase-binding transcription factor DksA
MKVDVKKPQENLMRKKILVKALSKNLDKMSKSPWVRSLKDGKDLVCPYCDQPVQPCKSDPSAMCERMLRAGTEGKEIENALKDSSNGSLGVCLSCGEQISMVHFKKHPTAELCPHCVKKGKKTKVKIVA